MANVKISGLTAASAVAAANEFEINEAGVSKKVTGTQIKTFVQSDLGSALYAYNSRSDFATAILSAPLSGVADGTVVAAGGHRYIKSTGATTLPSLNNWLPLQPFDAEQWGIVWDGSTDQTTNLNAAFSYVSTQGGGHINIPKKSSAIAINGSLVLEENVIADFNSSYVTGGTPAVVYTAVGAKLIWSRGAQLRNYWAGVAAGVAATYTGPFIQIEQGGADANISAPIVGKNIIMIADSTGASLAHGISSTEKVTFANIDGVFGQYLNAMIYAAPATGEWYNSNVFNNITGIYNKYTIYADTTNGAVSSNTFRGGIQADATYMYRGFYGVGANVDGNVIDIKWWDNHLLVAQASETQPCVIELGSSSSGDNIILNAPEYKYIRDRSYGSQANQYISSTSGEQIISGFIPPDYRYTPHVDFNNDSFAWAGDPQNPHWTISSSTVSAGSNQGPFTRNNSSSTATWTVGASNTWKYIGLEYASTHSVWKGLLTVWQGDAGVPLEVQYWWSASASPSYAQLEGAEGSITDWTKISDPLIENNMALYMNKGQTVLTNAKHIACRFLVPANQSTKLLRFAGVAPEIGLYTWLPTQGGDLYGNLAQRLGTSVTFESSNGAGSASIATSNSSHLDITATAGVRLGAGPIWAQGTGSPEGAVSAPVGSFYSRTDGGTGTSFYVKESGVAATGWVAK